MSRRRLPIVLPSLLLLAAALGWCLFWWVAASRLEAGVDRWIAREASAGRVYDCGERQVGGFPFRLEVDCRAPRATLPAETGPVRLAAARLLAVAQIYKPTHIIGQFEGPLTVSPGDGAPEVTARWSFAGVSFIGTPETLERVSLVSDDLAIEGRDGLAVTTAAKLESHARATPQAEAGSYDLITRLDGAVIPLLDGLLGSSAPTGIELQASAKGLDSVRAGTTAERLRAFTAAGGNLRIALARVTRGDIALQSEGELRLDALGRPEGRFDVTVRGAEKLAGMAPALGDLGPLAGAGISFLGQKATLDGQNARRFDVTLADGVARLGGLPVAQVPPLY